MKPSSPIQKLPNKTFILNLEIPLKDIQAEYQEHLKALQSNFETKGFRKGKAPLEVVESGVSPEKLFEEVASHLISHTYGHAIKEHQLKPIIQPQIKFKNDHPDFEHDWQIEITGCELPEIELNQKYLDEVKKVNSDPNIKEENQKIDQIVKTLIKNAKLDLPEILVESDLQAHLSGLISQTTQAGITVSQYLESQKQTLETYQEELKKRIVDEWTLNLAISQIAKDNKIEVNEAEVKDLLAKNPQLGENINMVYYLLTQQKVFDFLKK